GELPDQDQPNAMTKPLQTPRVLDHRVHPSGDVRNVGEEKTDGHGRLRVRRSRFSRSDLPETNLEHQLLISLPARYRPGRPSRGWIFPRSTAACTRSRAGMAPVPATASSCVGSG